jgi:hypothetical protein
MCDCVEKINKMLEPGGHRLNTAINFDGRPEVPLISLIRTDAWKIESRRGKPSSFWPSYCPFCGEKYPEADKAKGGAA